MAASRDDADARRKAYDDSLGALPVETRLGLMASVEQYASRTARMLPMHNMLEARSTYEQCITEATSGRTHAELVRKREENWTQLRRCLELAVDADLLSRNAARGTYNALTVIEANSVATTTLTRHPSLHAMMASEDCSMAPRWCCVVCGEWSDERCARCHVVGYCGAECQRTDWRSGHREACATLATQRQSVRACLETKNVTPHLIKAMAVLRGSGPQRTNTYLDASLYQQTAGSAVAISCELIVPIDGVDDVSALVTRHLSDHGA